MKRGKERAPMTMTLEEARETRAELKRAKAEYHERRSVCSAEERAHLSKVINDLVMRLREGEEGDRG